MKKWMAAVLAAILAFMLPIVALAELEKTLFDDAKQAVSLLSYGEYQKAIDKLDFSDNQPDSEEFARFVDENLDSVLYGDVQCSVAVGYRKGSAWRLAVPVEEPEDGSVQVLVLRSKDGQSFDAYTATSWRDVMAEVDESETVIWNEAYEPDDQVFLTDAHN